MVTSLTATGIVHISEAREQRRASGPTRPQFHSSKILATPMPVSRFEAYYVVEFEQWLR